MTMLYLSSRKREDKYKELPETVSLCLLVLPALGPCDWCSDSYLIRVMAP